MEEKPFLETPRVKHSISGPDRPRMIELRIAFFAASLSGFLYGYNIGVYSSAILEIQESFSASDAALSDLLAFFDFAEAVGVCLSFLADRFGRRRTLIIACTIMCVAPLLPLVQDSFLTLLVARGLSGLAAGYVFVIALVFVSEIAPKQKRPLMLSTIMVGLILGYMVELGVVAELVSGHYWRLAIAFGALPALIQLLGLTAMEESPAFYRLGGRDELALKSANYYGLGAEDLESTTAEPGIGAILRSLKNSAFRKRLWRGILLVAAGTTVGHALLLTYGPVLMEYFGVKDRSHALLILDLFTFLGLLAGFSALALIARGHTRNILLFSLFTMGFIQIFIGVSEGNVAILLLGALQITFTFGIRTTIFQLLPDLFDDATRAVGVAFLNIVFILISGLNSEIILILFETLQSTLFFAQGALAMGIGLACRRYLP